MVSDLSLFILLGSWINLLKRHEKNFSINKEFDNIRLKIWKKNISTLCYCNIYILYMNPFRLFFERSYKFVNIWKHLFKPLCYWLYWGNTLEIKSFLILSVLFCKWKNYTQRLRDLREKEISRAELCCY